MEPPWAAEEGKQPMNNVNLRKIAVIGCGFVGSASAFALMQSKLFSEIVLIDADHAKAEGEAMDISHGIPFVGNMKIYAGTYDDIVDAASIENRLFACFLSPVPSVMATSALPPVPTMKPRQPNACKNG